MEKIAERQNSRQQTKVHDRGAATDPKKKALEELVNQRKQRKEKVKPSKSVKSAASQEPRERIIIRVPSKGNKVAKKPIASPPLEGPIDPPLGKLVDPPKLQEDVVEPRTSINWSLVEVEEVVWDDKLILNGDDSQGVSPIMQQVGFF